MIRRSNVWGMFCCVTMFAAAASVQAQGRGGQNWSTYNGDAQRTSWMRADARISRESVEKPGAFQLLWKAKLDNQSRQLNSLTQPLLLNNIISYKGFKALAFIGGSADSVYAIDYDLNRPFWSRRLSAGAPAVGTAQCPGGLTAITRAATPGTPTVPGRGGLPASPPAPARGGGGGGGGNLSSAVYAIAGDGLAHVLNPQTGEDLSAPAKFLAPNAKVVGTILVDNVLYAATADGCGNVANGVWAVDLGSDVKTVTSWATKGGSVVGTAAPTLGIDGTVFVATGDGEYSDTNYSDAIVALQPQSLAIRDSFTPGKLPFISAPVVFQFKGRQLLVAVNKDGRLYVLDTASLGGADHKTALAKSTTFSTGAASALASWEDADANRWIVVSGSSSILAFKLVEQNGSLTLQPAWSSRDIAAPASPIVVNGVAFALASGGQRSGNAVLYALDAVSGKELWNSGTAITSFVHSGGLAAGDGQVYVPTYDNTLYAFGIPLEH